MPKEKILHIITVSFVINHFFGKQFLYLRNKNGNTYHLGCSYSAEFISLSAECGYTPFQVEITRDISPIKDIIAVYKIYKYIKKNKIDVVVGHTLKGALLAMISSFLAKVPKRIYFRHGLVYETSSGFKRVVLKNIDRYIGFLATQVVCVSHSVKEISIKDRLNLKNKNIVLGLGTSNGIDTLIKFNPDKKSIDDITKLKKKYNITNEDKVIGYVGRLVKDKGIDDLILAWNMVKLKFPNAKLLLVGPIETRDSITPYTKKIILTDPSIIFTDFIADASIYFLLMNIFILPTYREGFPTVSLEASSMRLPVIITKATGCVESIKENNTGLFISNEPNDIARAILYYLNNENIALQHGINGRFFVQQNFEQTKVWDLIAENLKI